MPTARFRSDGNQEPTVINFTVIRHVFNPGTEFSSVPVGNFAGSYRYMQDFVKTGFRKSSDFTKWVSNPYSSGKLVVNASNTSTTTSNILASDGSGITRVWSGDGVGYIFGALVGVRSQLSFGSFPDLVNEERLQQNAIVECLSKINPALSQSWVTAAEAHKSIQMILDRARKLADAYRAIRKLDVKALDRMFPGSRTKRYPKGHLVWDENGNPVLTRGGKAKKRFSLQDYKPGEIDRLTDAARLELEYRYGWTPLVHDIVDNLKALNAQALRDELSPKAFLAVNSVKEGSSDSSTILSVQTGGGRFSGLQTLTHKVKVRAYAKYTVSNPSGLANRMSEFGIFDVPKAIWELVPLSFAFDWIIPVGTWLSAVQPKVGVNVIESGFVLTAEKSVVRTVTGYVPDSTGVGSWPNSPVPIGASDSFVASRKSRSLGLPVPLFPPPEVNLNLKRLADAMALLRVMR